MSSLTVREALREGASLLAQAGGQEATLEAELLLRHVLGLDKPRLYQRLRQPLTRAQETAYRALLARRLNHEPTPYIVGRREFFGLELEVTPAAMIPRPETELLVELALGFIGTRGRGPQTQVVDVGVGCGAIAIALVANLPPPIEVMAIDSSPQALALARRNAQRLGLSHRIRLLQGHLLQPLATPLDLIVANLPYVKSTDWAQLPPEIRCFEPREALDGGPDGLRVIERLLRQACLPAGRRRPYLRPGGAVMLEIGDEQGDAVRRLAAESFPQAQVEIKQDLAGLDRVLVVRI